MEIRLADDAVKDTVTGYSVCMAKTEIDPAIRKAAALFGSMGGSVKGPKGFATMAPEKADAFRAKAARKRRVSGAMANLQKALDAPTNHEAVLLTCRQAQKTLEQLIVVDDAKAEELVSKAITTIEETRNRIKDDGAGSDEMRNSMAIKKALRLLERYVKREEYAE